MARQLSSKPKGYIHREGGVKVRITVELVPFTVEEFNRIALVTSQSRTSHIQQAMTDYILKMNKAGV